MNKLTISLCSLGLALTACDMGMSNVMLHTDNLPGDGILNPANNPDNAGPALACDFGYSYQGFGGTRLEAGRADEEVGFDRDRVKGYDALAGEYARVLGTTPDLFNDLGSTFGEVPPRWYQEPQATAVSLYSSMRVAFVGCLDFTNSADFDAMPDATNAPLKCSAFATKFWSRDPDTDEVASCVDVALNGTANEPAARRKWAYTCASVLSSAPFLTF
jgi:hypothetical protein